MNRRNGDIYRHIGPLSEKLKQDAMGLRAHGFVRAAPHLEGRAAEAKVLERRLVSLTEENRMLTKAIDQICEAVRADDDLSIIEICDRVRNEKEVQGREE